MASVYFYGDAKFIIIKDGAYLFLGVPCVSGCGILVMASPSSRY